MIDIKKCIFISLFFAVFWGGFTNFSRAGDFCYNWQKNLYYGMMNENDVQFLQVALAREGFFPEDLATGNFLSITLEAVKNFQEKYKEETLIPWNLQYGTGFVGKTTRAKLNEIYNCENNVSISTSTPVVSDQIQKPEIDYISPVSGPIGTQIFFSGSNFNLTSNTIYVGYEVLYGIPSLDGKTLTFIFFPPMPEEMKSTSFPLPFGFYVENKNGLSNVKEFQLIF